MTFLTNRCLVTIMSKPSQPIWITLLTLCLFGCLNQYAIDIYTPSLPTLTRDFNVSINLVQWSITVYTIGLSFTMLLSGPISEVLGRKIPLLAGVYTMAIGSIICAIAPNITTLIVGRLIQGLGAGAPAVLWRAIMRDLFYGDELAKYSAYLSPIIIGMLAIAPLLGGFAEHFLSWRASFVFLLLYAAGCIVIIKRLYKETHPQTKTNQPSAIKVMDSLKTVLSNRDFISNSFCSFLALGMFLSWFICGPFILIQLMHFTPIQFGWTCSLSILSMGSIGAFINARLIGRWRRTTLMRLGFSLFCLAGTVLLTTCLTLPQDPLGVIVPLLVVNLAGNFIWANATANAMTPFGHLAGYAATLFTFFQYAGGAIISSVLTLMPDYSAVPLAASWVTLALLGLFTTFRLRESKSD